jgi:Domain of unknown function (DUF4926)
MTTVKQAIHEHDVVALIDPVKKTQDSGKWAAGTVGAVVSDYGDVKLVEIANDRGEMLDLIQVREPRLKLIDKSAHAQSHA